MFNPKWVIGRTIVAVEMGSFRAREQDRTITHRPLFTLDNGARLFFSGDETDFGDYGVNVQYLKPEKGA